MKVRKPVNKQITFLLLFAFVFTFIHASAMTSFSNDDILHLNPLYKLKRMSTGEVIIYTKDQQPSESDFSFNEFYADVLLAAYRNQRVEYFVKTISEKYYLSDDECRRELKHAINVLSEWNIILMDRELANR